MGTLNRFVVGVLVAITYVGGSSAIAHGGEQKPLKWRGVIEGFYGKPWSHEQRIRVLDFMADQKFNSYIYASKDDPFQRARWREAYPRSAFAQLRSEIKFAKRHGIRWIPNISPAKPLLPTKLTSGEPSAPLCFSCKKDLDLVAKKLGLFQKAGVDTFMVSFDDVTPSLDSASDRERFGSGEAGFARANAYFLNRLQQHLRLASSTARLVTVSARYAGTGSGPYLQNFGRDLSREIEVMWTGTGILSQNFTSEQADSYAKLIRRKPILWDNWTSTDTTGANSEQGSSRIFLGPYVRRADAAGSIHGVFINPMNLPVLNELSLATAAEWMRDPKAYSPRGAWLKAVHTVAQRWSKKKRVEETLRAWAESSYSTRLDERNAPTFERLSARLVAAYDGSSETWESRRDALLSELAMVENAPTTLGKGDPQFRKEAGAFLAAAKKAARAARIGVALLDAKRDFRDASDLRSKFETAAANYRSEWQLVYGWRGMKAQDLGSYPVPENAIEKFERQVRDIG